MDSLFNWCNVTCGVSREIKMIPKALPERFPFIPSCLFTDVDDTLTLNGKIPVETFAALDALQQAGITVVPVTGACGGWCDCIVRTWPVSTIIGENGAFIMSLIDDSLNCQYIDDQEERAQNAVKLQSVIAQVKQRVPGAQLARDCSFRLTDIAFDIGQDQKLAPEEQARIMDICQHAGVNARASSIHINIWQGEYTKATTAALLLKQWGLSSEMAIFVGDSLNDEAMFSYLETSVGVANIGPYLDQLQVPPAYITSKPGGLGFAHLAQSILRVA